MLVSVKLAFKLSQLYQNIEWFFNYTLKLKLCIVQKHGVGGFRGKTPVFCECKKGPLLFLTGVTKGFLSHQIKTTSAMDIGRLDQVNEKYSAEFDKQRYKSNKLSGSSGAKTSE